MRRTVTIMVAGALLIALTAGVALAATINCVGDSAKAPTTKIRSSAPRASTR
ncbi:MAG TPA: hypothetical protein VIZ60_05750 [Rubrobacter sp.]